ncbi:hypothetical protein G6F45_014242 [Rhizopus arrhizus]|nr:hypothetical protein G6F35_018257 [Rhizopus arrhizus]KAG1604374.1 hypothetical protein G6F45_014242 [Rhizopus arrhizus]
MQLVAKAACQTSRVQAMDSTASSGRRPVASLSMGAWSAHHQHVCFHTETCDAPHASPSYNVGCSARGGLGYCASGTCPAGCRRRRSADARCGRLHDD